MFRFLALASLALLDNVTTMTSLSCVPSFVNRQKQDLRDFMICQDWEISITERFQS